MAHDLRPCHSSRSPHSLFWSALKRETISSCAGWRPDSVTKRPPTAVSRMAARESEKTIAGRRSSANAPATVGSARSTVKKSAASPGSNEPARAPILSAPATLAHSKRRAASADIPRPSLGALSGLPSARLPTSTTPGARTLRLSVFRRRWYSSSRASSSRSICVWLSVPSATRTPGVVEVGRRAEGNPDSAPSEGRGMSALAARLFECASVAGAESIGARAGSFEPGLARGSFTVDLADPTVAGALAEHLLPAIVLPLSRAAIRETAVGGRFVTESGRHPAQDEIVSRFNALQKRLWGGREL